MLQGEEEALPAAGGVAVEHPVADPPATAIVPLAVVLVCLSRQVSHSQVESGPQEGSVARRLELEEELGGGPHHGAGQLPDPAEGPDQRRELVHPVVDLVKRI